MTKSIVIGLTGCMGAGKSTAVRMIKQMIVPVFDCDDAVHRLMRENRDMIALFARRYSQSVVHGEIDRGVLSALIDEKKLDVRELEQMIYPFLEAGLRDFFARHRYEPVVVLDVPLLFEAGWDKFCDKIIVVTAPADVLKKRVFDRQNMTKEKYDALTDRQLSDEQKRAKADYVVDTRFGKEPVREKLAEILEEIKCAKSF